jgi:hypothetical protein
MNTPTGVLTVGLDIGESVVKVVTDENSFGFPSVMGHVREIKFQQETIQQKYPGDQITDDEREWFVGDLALAQLRPVSFYAYGDGLPMKNAWVMPFEALRKFKQ